MAIKVRILAAIECANQIATTGKFDEQCSSIKKVLEYVKIIKNLTLEDRLVSFKNRAYILYSNELKLTVTQQACDAKKARHLSRDKRMELLQRYYYWPNLNYWVKTYVRTCDACQ